jgi:DNA-binding transcriptional LysR family regulator
MQGMIEWDDLRHLAALHRGGSLAGAARLLGVDATTVGRRLAALEERLQARLVDRTQGVLSLSAAGRRALAASERMEEQVLALEREVTGADARVEGVVRVTAGEALSAFVLVPALAPLQERHPALRLEVLADNRTYDLTRREADLGVRAYRPREPSLLARRLGALEYGLFAAPAYLVARRAPRRLADLAGHRFVAFESRLDDAPEARWLRRHVPAPDLALRSNSTHALLAACAAGYGLLATAVAFGGRVPGLVRVLPSAALPEREVWAALHPDLRGAARVSAVVERLAQALGGRYA